jgi:predicted molibdopterin-dependent oxidoreductase YjgC
MALVQLTIDGKQVFAEEGTPVLEAARTVGIEIPALCYHCDLPPNAACRLCLVEVEGQRLLQASCTLRAAEGMVVRTDTPKVQRVRKLMLELLLSEHPRDCMTCEQAGACEFQDLAYKLGVEDTPFNGVVQRFEWIADDNPFIIRDYCKCINCWRCTAACAEVQGRFAIAKGYRALESHPVAGLDVPYDHSICEFCGQCVAYCPTGALTERSAAAAGRTWEMEKVTTTCPYCGVGCNFDLNVHDNRIVKVTSNEDAPVNGMALCVKGRFGWDFVHHPERLTKPLIRKDGVLVESSWDEALGLVAGRLGEIKAESGGDAIAVLTSAKCTNEENYVAQKFARAVLGTNNVDHCARL